MKIKISKEKIYLGFILCIFFDAYCFFMLGNRGITLFYPMTVVLFAFCIVRFQDVLVGIKINPFAIIMIFYAIINYFIENTGKGNLPSLVVMIFVWLFYIFTYRKINQNDFMKLISAFQNGMNIMAMYGIYQLCADILNFPFGNLWVEGHMVIGYNWGNVISIGNVTFKRPNAIFREPSFFAVLLAINITIYIQRYIDNTKNKTESNAKLLKKLVLNILALICTFTGTGILMLLIGILSILFFNHKKTIYHFVKNHIFLLCLIILILIYFFFIPNPIRNHFLNRITEFNPNNTKSVSGYKRFIMPLIAIKQVFESNKWLLGTGLHNSENMINSTVSAKSTIVGLIPRTMAELGVVGTAILFMFLVKSWRKENNNIYYKILFFCIIAASFMWGSFTSELWWILFGMINVSIVLETNDIRKNAIDSM